MTTTSFPRLLLSTALGLTLIASTALAQNAPSQEGHRDRESYHDDHGPADRGLARDDHRDAPYAAAVTAHAAPQAAYHHDSREHDHGRDWNDHHDRDWNDHNDRPDVIVHIEQQPYYRPAPYYPPHYVRERPIAYRHHVPYYYTSYYYDGRYIPIEPASPYVEVRCSDQPIIGTVVGGAAGGLAGNLFARGAHHGGRTAATIGGALLGAVLGNAVDRANETCAYQALEYGQPNTQVTWVDPTGGDSYTVTPGPVTNEGNGEYCREYQAKIMVGGQLQDGYGRACRQPDGSWKTED